MTTTTLLIIAMVFTGAAFLGHLISELGNFAYKPRTIVTRLLLLFMGIALSCMIYATVIEYNSANDPQDTEDVSGPNG
jgi:hypothetical protein